MSLSSRIRTYFLRRFASAELREAQRVKAEAKRQREGRPHEVLYFHQPDDPYSQLAVQAVAPFLQRYAVVLRPVVVDQPTPIAIHEQGLWDAWARTDAAAIAPYHGLRFLPGAAHSADTLQLARKLLLTVNEALPFAELAQQVSAALAEPSPTALQALAQGRALPSDDQAEQQLKAHFAQRHALGHYLGGMFYYEGEWYWGIDRLHYLEHRLDGLGARRADAPAGNSIVRTPLPAAPATHAGQRLQLEFFCSLRSPYTHLSYERVRALAERYPVDLIVRPVLPMMMRGVKADRRKGQYIFSDTKREAERMGIAFGNLWDPFGKPILRAYSLFPWARDQGRGFEYLHSYSQAVWGECVNAMSLEGLKGIVERAGLNWQQALKHLDNRAWEAEMEANVQAMLNAGSWGVPTLRLLGAGQANDFTVWGQDRLWLVEAEIIRRMSGAH